jgi:hypothetical protein
VSPNATTQIVEQIVEQSIDQAEQMLQKMWELDILEAKMEVELQIQQEHLDKILQEEEAIKLLLAQHHQTTARESRSRIKITSSSQVGVPQVVNIPASIILSPAAERSSTAFDLFPSTPSMAPPGGALPTLR